MFKIRRLNVVVLFAIVTSFATVTAQMPTPTPELDSRGLPLPFGVPPYFKPDVPLGTGPYKAIMSEEKGLTRQIVYYQSDLTKLGTKKLPVLLWANGSCLYAGNRYRQFLTEIASHGYLVIAGGPIGEKAVEVGPQQNPAVGGRGAAAPAAQAPARGGARAGAVGGQVPARARGGVDAAAAPPAGRVTAEIMKEGLDWAFARNADSASRFYGKVDTQHVVMWGHSCGGAVAIEVATTDPRVTTLGVWFSGLGLIGRGNNDAGVVQKIRGPVLVISGTQALDIAYPSAKNTFERIENNPVFYAWRDDMQHIGTFGAANGGELGRLAVNWLEWQTRGDQNAAKWFKGAGCILCKDAAWHVQKKKIDKST